MILIDYRELYGNNISGEIPDDLGNLENLVSLDLYLNGLTGPIPDTFGKLTQLRFLYEYYTSFLFSSLWYVTWHLLCFYFHWMRTCFPRGLTHSLCVYALSLNHTHSSLYVTYGCFLLVYLWMDSRLNDNKLSGLIPISLINISTLQVL